MRGTARRDDTDTLPTERIRERLGTRNIVLIGMMGAGKTSIGRRLAAALDIPFADADAEIELAANQTIPEIFANFGEAHFRDGERKVIAGVRISLFEYEGLFMAMAWDAGG